MLKTSLLQVTGSNEKAVEAYEKAAEANLRGGGTSWHAAKHLEAAAKICVEMGKHDRAHQLLIDSSNEYISCGKLSPAAECLGRGARWLEEVKPDSACDLYRQALDMYMKSEMGSMAHDVVQRGAGAMIRKDAFAEAASLLLKWATICYGHENTALMNRAYLGPSPLQVVDVCHTQHTQCVATALEKWPTVSPTARVHMHGLKRS